MFPYSSPSATDSRVMWLLSGMLVCVKELWIITDKCDIYVSKWHGWLMAYLTKKCFPGVNITQDRYNPIKSKYVTTVEKIIDKVNIAVSTKYRPADLESKFDDHENIFVLFKCIIKDMIDMVSFAD